MHNLTFREACGNPDFTQPLKDQSLFASRFEDFPSGVNLQIFSISVQAWSETSPTTWAVISMHHSVAGNLFWVSPYQSWFSTNRHKVVRHGLCVSVHRVYHFLAANMFEGIIAELICPSCLPPSGTMQPCQKLSEATR